MFRRFAARFVVGTSVLFLAMAGSSSAWRQYGDHYGHGHGGSAYYGTRRCRGKWRFRLAPTDAEIDSLVANVARSSVFPEFRRIPTQRCPRHKAVFQLPARTPD